MTESAATSKASKKLSSSLSASILFLVFFIVAFIQPINNFIYRSACILMLLGFAVSLFFLLKPYKKARIGYLSLIIVIFLSLMLPWPKIDTKALHQSYIEQLPKYAGADYVWGGEGYRGIDCSGLPRKALRDALCEYSYTKFNPHSLLLSLEQWWFDTSALALSQGYRNFTYSLNIQGVLNKLDTSKLKTGDLAVTANGVHVLVYLGNDHWIQADPAGKVVIDDARTSKNFWLDSNVNIFRWQVFKY